MHFCELVGGAAQLGHLQVRVARAEEHRLVLVHPRTAKQEGGIVVRDDRGEDGKNMGHSSSFVLATAALSPSETDMAATPSAAVSAMVAENRRALAGGREKWPSE